jgi:hypothetical protein
MKQKGKPEYIEAFSFLPSCAALLEFPESPSSANTASSFASSSFSTPF